MVYSSDSATPPTPKRNVKYPIVLGESIRKPCSSRKFMSIKVSDVPRSSKVHSAAVLTPNNHGCSLELATSSGEAQAVRVACKRQKSVAHEVDVVLVFHNEKWWLERVDHTYSSRGTAKIVKKRKRTPPNETDVMEDDPDSWMRSEAMSEYGSPLTPERNEQGNKYDSGDAIDGEEEEIEVEMETGSSSDERCDADDVVDNESECVTKRGELGRSNLNNSLEQSDERKGVVTWCEDSDSECNSYNSSDYTDASSDEG